MSPVVAVLHPGQLGAAIGAVLRKRGVTVLWCTTGRSRDSARRAREADLVAVRELDELLDRANVILSICPPPAAEGIAAEVTAAGYRGLYVEANAISPGRFRRIFDSLTAGGATVLDASVMGLPGRSSARLYLAGNPTSARKVTALFADTDIEAITLGEQLGAASALKLAHLSYQKAARALAAVSHALAADFGVTDHLLAEAEVEPRSALAEPDHLAGVAGRASRTAPEMLEGADALTDAGLPPQLAQGAHHVLQLWARGSYRPGTPLEEVLAGLRDVAVRA